jgi:glycosyltransferase involved in cell wall biosynthesis
MISVLIPVYNYNISSLLKELHSQLELANIRYEIICLDDFSDYSISSINLDTAKLTNTKYLKSEVNNGIAITRQKLVKKASYDWVILLDADTRINKNFISSYLGHISNEYDFVFGGFKYDETPPLNEKLLRWTYGKKCEAISARLRNKNPYKVTIGANLLVHRESFLNLGLDNIGNNYAMDYFFGSKLKTIGAKVFHIDNQVFHLGIENSSTYLQKKERAVNTLLMLYKQEKIAIHSNDLLRAFIFLRKVGLNYLFSFWFNSFRKKLTANLTGKRPSIMLLQLYKISYMCSIDLKKEKAFS